MKGAAIMVARAARLAAASALVVLVLAGVARADLVQYWKFDETGGVMAANAAAGGNPGTLVNFFGIEWSADVPAVASHSTGSLAFSMATDQYVNAGIPGLLCTEHSPSNPTVPNTIHGVTVSVWLKPGATSDNRIWSQLEAGSGPYPYPFGATRLNGGTVNAWTADASGWLPVTQAGTVQADQWQHLAVTWIGNKAIGYLNGVPTDLVARYCWFDFDDSTLGIGARYFGLHGVSYDGLMDDFAIWNRALTPPAIVQLAAGADPLSIVDRPALPSYSQIVNIDAKTTLASYQGHAAIAAAGTYWNDAVISGTGGAAGCSLTDALDSQGTGTPIDVSFSNFSFSFAENNNPMFGDRLIAARDTGNNWQIDGLEVGATYDLFFYGFVASEVNVLSGAPEATAAFLINSDGHAFNVLDDIPEDWVEGVNYLRLTVTPTESTVTGNVVVTSTLPGVLYSGIAGIQIARQGPPRVPGDASGDGKVDDLDASILAAHWQKMGGATWGEGDFNGDGNVDDLDASFLAANWPSGAGGAAVPEPSTLALLAIGLAVAAALPLAASQQQTRTAVEPRP